MRTLVDTGFLRACEVRHGTRGALERPYQATGKSWDVSIQEGDDARSAHSAMVDAFRQELELAGPPRTLFLSRFANRLNEASYTDLWRRIEAIVEEFALRDDPDGVRMAFFLGGHVRDEVPPWPVISERDD